MKEFSDLFLFKYLVQRGSFAFSDVLRHCLYAAAEYSLTELNLDHVTDLQIVCGFDDAGVYHHVALAASIVCNGATLDDTGYLQKFI